MDEPIGLGSRGVAERFEPERFAAEVLASAYERLRGSGGHRLESAVTVQEERQLGRVAAALSKEVVSCTEA